MRTFKKLYGDCADLISVLETEREKIIISPERSDSALSWACRVIRQLLHVLGISICKDGELNRATLLLLWASAMLPLSKEIEIGSYTVPQGFVLTARINRGHLVAGHITRKPHTVNQLFAWNDSRSHSDANVLCERRAAHLINSIKADSENN